MLRIEPQRVVVVVSRSSEGVMVSLQFVLCPIPTFSVSRANGTRGRFLALCLAIAITGGATGSKATTDKDDQTITPNFKDADITLIAEAVSAATGKNFIVDPRVRAQVTMLSSTPMSPAAFYEAFLAILQVHGFVAIQSGAIVKLLPDANAKQLPSNDLPDQVSGTSEEIVTQVVDVKNVSAAQLVPVLRPLIPQWGQLAAYPASNILIISDRANNISRLIKIIRRIDQVGDQDVEIVPLENASASDTTRVVNSLFQQAAAAEGGVAVKVVADERSNSVLISGDQSQRLRLRALIAHLDTPLKRGGHTQVRYLHFADAEKIAPKLKEQITGIAQASAGGTGGTAGGQASPQAQAEKNAIVWADPATNSLIITAPPTVMEAIMDIVDRLDIRRPQVLVEAVIVEVNSDKTSDFGINWAAWSDSSSGTQIPAGAFVSAVGGSSIVDLASTALSVSNGSTSSLSSFPSGTSLALGRIKAANGINFGATLRAVRGDADTNIIATPSAITLDNQEAELKVAQEVPFITGQYSTGTSGTTTSTSVNPFTTVQRQEVGTILKVTPQIAAEGDSVVLKISLESSSVATTSVSSVDITTNKRTVSTNVLIEDGGIIVLGGLIQDTRNRSEQKVPLLGSIPLIGLAFKTRNVSHTKSNLMVFIRPKILRTAEQTAIETGSKYNYMLDQEKKADQRELFPLLPGDKKPTLPALPARPNPTNANPSTSPDAPNAKDPNAQPAQPNAKEPIAQPQAPLPETTAPSGAASAPSEPATREASAPESPKPATAVPSGPPS